MPLAPEIVVTGLGVWCAGGTTPAAVFDAACRGLAAGTWTTFDDRRFAVGRAPDPPPVPGFPQAHRMDRSARLALAAALPAYAAARLHEVEPARIAVIVGNSRGPVGAWTEAPAHRRRPTRVAHTAIAALSGALSLALHVRGPCLTVSATCASAAHAIGLGALMLRAGLVDAVLAGGAEAPLLPDLLGQFEAAGILGNHPDPAQVCRPFDLERRGTLPGEGAAFLTLEAVDHARRRGVPRLAALEGFAFGAESHNRVAARDDGDGLIRVMRQALGMAGLAPGDVGHVNAHGTGTRVNDAAEAAALRAVFGRACDALPVTSTKPVTGHTFGAAAAIEAVVAIESLRHQQAPPTAGCRRPDPAFGLDVVLGSARRLATRRVMSNSLGFWGNAASLIFSVAEGA